MKHEIIRAEMAEDVIQEVLLLRKVMCFHAVSTQSVIEDVSHHGVQLCVRVIAVLMAALFQDVLHSETGLKNRQTQDKYGRQRQTSIICQFALRLERLAVILNGRSQVAISLCMLYFTDNREHSLNNTDITNPPAVFKNWVQLLCLGSN